MLSHEELLDNWPLLRPFHQVGDALIGYEIYKRIVRVPGDVFEFGCRHGRMTSLLLNLRALLEPHSGRYIFAFDTFEGFRDEDLHDYDRAHRKHQSRNESGRFRLPEGYSVWLRDQFRAQGHSNLGIVAGPAQDTVPRLLGERPHTVVALAWFDMDLYEPTKQVLRQVVKHLAPGGLIVMDEYNCPFYPGESVAVRDVFGTSLKFERLPWSPYVAFARWPKVGDRT